MQQLTRTATRTLLAWLLAAGCLVGLIVSVGAQIQASGAEGTWRGTLSAGGANLRLVLRIAKAADGLHTGALDSLDQGSTIPIDSITVTGDTVRIELKAIGGRFEGTLNAARTELKGVWSQGAPLPLTFTRDATTAPSPAAAPDPPRPVTAATFPFGLPLEVRTPIAPAPFLGSDGKTYLAYEVHVTNMGPRDLLLARMEVTNGSAPIAAYEGSDLNGLMALPGSPGLDRRTVPAGRRVVVFVWIAVDSPASAPASLRHRFTVGELTLDSPPITVSRQPPVVIAPPLSGDRWLAANGPGPASVHRRALIPIEGGAYIAQRFAVDWVQLWPSGTTFTGDQKDNKSYRAYGANVLAVADAIVAATRDGIPENIPGPASRAVPITAETIGGNRVVLDLGGGRFALYAHLQPGSLRVKVGDRVTRGQVLGLVGNSGNSTEPHLHFHLSDSVSPLGSEGLPYAILGMTGMPLQNARVNFAK
jgi:hypothetical protein